MKVVSISDFRANVAGMFDRVVDDVEHLVVTRGGHEPMVVLTKAEYDSWVETDYLLRGANGEKLLRAIADLNAGKGEVHELFDGDSE